MCVTFGCEILDSFTVTSLDSLGPEKVKVSGIMSATGQCKEITAKAAVLCAGPWANDLLKQLE